MIIQITKAPTARKMVGGSALRISVVTSSPLRNE